MNICISCLYLLLLAYHNSPQRSSTGVMISITTIFLSQRKYLLVSSFTWCTSLVIGLAWYNSLFFEFHQHQYDRSLTRSLTSVVWQTSSEQAPVPFLVSKERNPFYSNSIFGQRFQDRESQFRKCARATHSSFNVGVSFAVGVCEHRQSACEPFPASRERSRRERRRTVSRRLFFTRVFVSCLSES